jgi:hypothetical protein
MWQKIRLWLAILGLAALSVSGFWGVDQEWVNAGTWAERFSAFMQIAYSTLGLLAIVPLWRRLGWARAMLYLWTFTLVMTGATAPVVWGQGGWLQAGVAAAITGACAAIVIWLAPLPAAEGTLRRWRWPLIVLGVLAVLVASWAMVKAYTPAAERLAPLILHAKQMEGFCTGLPSGIDRGQLTAMAQRQGYVAAPGHDDKGDLLKLTDPLYPGQYYCRARFKPDGTIAEMNFTAGSNAK